MKYHLLDGATLLLLSVPRMDDYLVVATACNSNSHDSVYGAVTMAVHCHCESSPGSFDECSTHRQMAADFWTKPIGCNSTVLQL